MALLERRVHEGDRSSPMLFIKNGSPVLIGLITFFLFLVTGQSVSGEAFDPEVPPPDSDGSLPSLTRGGPAPSRAEDRLEGAVLPDLQNFPPSDLRLIYSVGRKYLRFSVSIWNSGPGVLELVGEPSDENDDILVRQRIYAQDGAEVGEQVIGNFIYHPFHFHMHLGEFAVYEIWSVRYDFTLMEVVATGGKISYCVRDISRVEVTELDGGAVQALGFNTCTARIQGLTPGWTDIYAYYLPGQSIEISHLPDGIYGLSSTVNPDKNLYETDLSNNVGLTYFTLYGLKIRVLSRRITEGAIRKLSAL